MDKIKLKEIAENLAKEYAQSQLESGFIFAGAHIYYDKNSKLIYFKIRLKHPDGRKWIRPFHFSEEQQKYVMREPEFIGRKPLYNLPELYKRIDEPVFIFEGEKCCEASSCLDLLSVTSGSATSAKQTDWAPLENRIVYIWPDNNEEGFKYAEEVKQILTKLHCDIKTVDVKKLNIPPKGDIVDWLNENPNGTKDNIFSLPMIELETITEDEGNIDYENIISEYAKLSEINYQLKRKDAAKRIKISVLLLDKLVKQVRNEQCIDSSNIFPNIEPWPEAVHGENLLNELENMINRFMVFPSEYEAKAIALHIVHTHCIDSAYCSPILNISSPEKRCGKSTLISVLQHLVNRPLVASNISSAAVFRSVEKWQPTLILDEADTFLPENEEIRGVINSGHTRESAFIVRCIGDSHEPNRFNTWCPKIIAGIGHLPETIEDRSIVIQLRRKLSNEKKNKLRDVQKSEFLNLLNKCVRFAIDNIEELKSINPLLPISLNDRAADNWTPLICIATLAGDEWLTSALKAAEYLSGNKQESVSIRVELLQDIKNVFDTKKMERLSTYELLEALCSEAEAPWATYNRGKPLSARQLANKLREFKIRSKDLRIPPHNKNLKGYCYDDFLEVFSCYIPSSSI